MMFRAFATNIVYLFKTALQHTQLKHVLIFIKYFNFFIYLQRNSYLCIDTVVYIESRSCT